MSYAMAQPLQSAVFNALLASPAVQALVGSDIYDATPSGSLPATYVLLGEEDVRARSDISAAGALHEFTVTIVSTAAGFSGAKDLAGVITDLLTGSNLALSRGRVVWLAFLRARARRSASVGERQVELRFRAQVEDI